MVEIWIKRERDCTLEGQIGRIHTRYRMSSLRGPASSVASRLDRLCRERLPDALGDALERVLPEDQAVYVIRRIETRLFLDLEAGETDVKLANRWASSLARSVGEAITGGAGARAEVIRFDDSPDFVARFVSDLLGGDAWDRWYYRPFEPYRTRECLSDTLRDVLLDHAAALAEILARLQRLGCLGRMLAALEPRALRQIWLRIQGLDLATDHEGARPLVVLAVRLLVLLDLWSGPPAEIEALCRAYVATGPAPADWRDRRALTEALLDVVRFLASLGAVRKAPVPSIKTLVLPEFDWLDLELARVALEELVEPRPSLAAAVPELDRIDLEHIQVPPEELGEEPPSRADILSIPRMGRGRGPTPRQRELLGDLLSLAQQGGLPLDREQPDSPGNALSLFAALVARAPRWANDPIAPGLIQNLLSAWAGITRAATPGWALRHLRQGEVEAALRLLPEGARHATVGTFQAAAQLGSLGLELIEMLSGETSGSFSTCPLRTSIETGYAGVFLLLRTVQDLRLRALAAEAGRNVAGGEFAFELLLISAGRQLAGTPAPREGWFDPALALLAGLEEPPTPRAVDEAWDGLDPSFHPLFGAALLRQLAGLRVLTGDVLHVYPLIGSGETLTLVGGDQPAGPWPLGRIISRWGEAQAILYEWRDLWEDVTGSRPDLMCDEQVTRLLSEDLPARPAAPLEKYRAGEGALRAALDALDHGWLGRAEADLTSSLTAIALVRVWARWLRQFDGSSIPYLLERFLRRPGRLIAGNEEILVEYERRPLDVVLEMAGYLSSLESVPWLGGRRVRFRPL